MFMFFTQLLENYKNLHKIKFSFIGINVHFL